MGASRRGMSGMKDELLIIGCYIVVMVSTAVFGVHFFTLSIGKPYVVIKEPNTLIAFIEGAVCIVALFIISREFTKKLRRKNG